MKMAASAAIRHHMPTMPRLGSTHGASELSLTGTVSGVCIIHNSNLDPLGALGPIAACGCLRLAPQQSCTKAAVKQLTIPASRRPMDQVRQSSRENRSEQDCRQRSMCQWPERLHQCRRSDSSTPIHALPHRCKCAWAFQEVLEHA